MTSLLAMGIEAEIRAATANELRCYLDGASRDGTFSSAHRTLRISQKGTAWLTCLSAALTRLGSRSWAYKETRRDVWTLETTWWDPIPPVTAKQKAAFVRGYFDAEGGVPRSPEARFYVQLVQKDYRDLSIVRDHLETIGIRCGRLHNPSVAVDPDYWRFFVSSASQLSFCLQVSSWHPRKRFLLDVHISRAQARKEAFSYESF